MIIKIDRGDYYIEYELKSLLIRFLVLVLFLMIIAASTKYILDSQKSEKEFEIALENDATSDYETMIVKKNSKGSFYSLKENVYVEGTVDIIDENGEKTISFGPKFKITNNNNIYLILSTTPNGKEQVKIGKLLGNVGKQNYALSSNVDLSDHQYVVLWDNLKYEALAYAKIYEETQ